MVAVVENEDKPLYGMMKTYSKITSKSPL